MAGRALGYIAAAVCVAAGAYLLQYGWGSTSGSDSTLAGGTSWFEVIAHGMGIYFVGKGLFVARATHLEAEQADRLRQLVEFGLHAQNERTRKPV